MAADQQFCLRWNNHQSTLVSVFDTLLENGSLVDCTLAAEGQYIKVHKVVLSACSPYFEVLMNQHYENHPIVILKDVKFQEMKAMIDYMYRGEVNISQDQLSTFLKAAESLQIKGLSDGGGGETDSRDVGSTTTTKRADPPPRKVPPPAPAVVPQPRSEPRKTAENSPVHSREGSISPSLRKRRRIRRPSQGDDSNDIDSASNTSDILSQGQSAPSIVPSIPASMTPIVPPPPAPVITKPHPLEEEEDQLSRLDSSSSSTVPPESGLIKAKIEPCEGLIEPKTEYLDYLQNENSVEDLTLDDDEEEDMDNMDMSRPGPSQGFLPWQMSGNQSGSDEVFMAAQEAVGQGRRDSQDNEFDNGFDFSTNNMEYNKQQYNNSSVFKCERPHTCMQCGKSYQRRSSLRNHVKFYCGKSPQFSCPQCSLCTSHKGNLKAHFLLKHPGVPWPL